jgi:hypothetical protein
MCSPLSFLSLVLLFIFCGCRPVGDVTLTTWGEDFIEQGIPATVFEDGYSVRYTKFLVVIKDFTMATQTGVQGPTQSAPQMVDLTQPGPLELGNFTDVDALKYDRVSYGIGPSSDEPKSVQLEGTLSKGTESKHFAWSFTLDTHYSQCSNPDFGEGVTVPNGGSETVELTIHGDHLWYDDLASPDAKVRGTAIANADANSDGEITQAELTAVQLTTLPIDQYGTGTVGNVKTLNDFVTALVRTLGHFRGEGECVTASR